jgi:hypothetical protein
MMNTCYKYALIPLLAGLLISCEKEEDTDSDNEEFAEEISATITVDFETISQDIYLLTSGVEGGRGLAKDCGTLYDTTFVKMYTGEHIAYSYTLDYGYEFTCSPFGIPQSLAWTYSCDGVWNGVRFNADGASTGSLLVTELVSATDEYVVNGAISREQELVQKYRDQKTFTTQSTIQLSDLKIDKNTLNVTTGSATFTANGVSSTGATYVYSCVVTYGGAGTALFTFSDGATYTLDLATMEFE